MNHIVTFETAQKLKDAGFPQPKLETWQIWYFNDTVLGEKAPVLITRPSLPLTEHELSALHYGTLNSFTVRIETFLEVAFFAPTATDILEQLPTEFLMCKHLDQWSIMKHYSGLTYARHENSAEAAAIAYLNHVSK